MTDPDNTDQPDDTPTLTALIRQAAADHLLADPRDGGISL